MRRRIIINQLQQHLYNHYRQYPEDLSYNITYAFELSGEINAIRLKTILDNVVDSYEILKTNFDTEDSKTFLSYDSDRKYDTEIILLQAETEKHFLDEAKKHIKHYQDNAIFLENWPLINIKIFCCKEVPEETVVMCSIPHIIADVYSFYTFLYVVCEIYDNGIAENKIKEYLKELKEVSYLDIESKTYVSRESKYGYEIKRLGISALNQHREGGKLKGNNLVFEIKNKQEIDNIIRNYGISPFIFFLSIHAMLLHKILGEDEISIGIPLANRKKEYRKTFGYFVNTLPMCIVFSENMTFSDLLNQLSKKLFLLLRNQNLDIRYYLHGENDYVNNCFTYYKESLIPRLRGVDTKKLFLKNSNIQFEVSSIIEEKENSYAIYYEYGKYLGEVDIQSIFLTILTQVLKGKENIDDIKLLEIEDINNEYKQFNSIFVHNNQTKWMDIFSDVVKQYGNKVAVVYKNHEITFEELNRKSNSYAAWIVEKYVNKQNIVVSIQKNIELVILIVAIQKAGKTYVPMPENLPEERKRKILEDLENFAVINMEKIELIEQYCLASQTKDLRQPNISEISYIIFTSGTTGKPKGVEITEANLLNMILSAQKEFSFSYKDIWAFVHSYGFDASIWEIFCSLSSGAKLVIVDEQIKKSPKEFRNLLYDNKVTVMLQTPTAFKMFSKIENEYDTFLSLRLLFLGAEELQFSILRFWIEKYKLDKLSLYNLYGPTESTVVTTFYKICERDIKDGLFNIIGKPFSHLECYVLDDKYNILPIGIEGELAISGSSVAKGYNNREELSREKFIELVNGKRVYLTGDKVKVDKNKQLQYLGRIDRQFQIRGFRVECGEIETVFEQEYNNSKCIVDCIQLRENESALVAYYISETAIDISEIKQALRKNLPDYMIPLIFARIDKIPFTMNGKIDYNKLKMNMNLIEKENKKIKDTATIEGKIQSIIAKAVGHNEIELEDELINIGVSSIHIPTIYDELVKEFELFDWDIADLFDIVSVKDLVQKIKGEKKANG